MGSSLPFSYQATIQQLLVYSFVSLVLVKGKGQSNYYLKGELEVWNKISFRE